VDIVVAAVSLAAIYGLIGVGLSLTWAGLGMLNLAHGITFAASGYGAWLVAEHVSRSGPLIIAGGIVTGALCGLIVWLAVFVPLDGREGWDFRSMVATLALAIIGTNALVEIFGSHDKSLPDVFGTGTLELPGYNVTADRIGAVVTSVAIMTLVVLALRRTRVGLGVRALTQSREGATLVGIGRVQSAAAILAVSGALAGLSAVLLAQTFYVSPEAGFTPMFKGLIVALLGGLGSVGGAVIAALIVGITEAVTARVLDQSYVLIALFVLIALMLLLRPRGVAGLLESNRA
jgi:branched-chain amino acid transport system permease protein